MPDKDPANAIVDFVIIEDGKLLPASSVVTKLDKLSISELDQTLGYAVSFMSYFISFII